MNSQTNLEESMYNIIQIALNRGFTTTEIKKKFNQQIKDISNRNNSSSKPKRKKKTVKAVRVPIWFSDDSDDE